MNAWLSVVGIGEDGLEGLSPAARAAIADAQTLVGGKRHLAFAAGVTAEKLAWENPLANTLDAIARRRGTRVVVLASGDPMWFGAGATLARRFPAAEMRIVPHVSSLALAAARMAWPLADCTALSVHGRPLAALALHLADRVRLLLLTHDGATPATVAAFLATRGFGASRMTAIERAGGSTERRVAATAGEWPHARIDDLNVLAVECVAGPDARPLPRVAGLPDDCFEHDGQLTKRAVRAITLAALAPLPGQLLWDVGAGNGSVAIEWLRAGAAMRAIAIERDAHRRGRVARNAETLGVPDIEIAAGDAPEALAGLDTPDAVFVGGGVSTPGVLAACWAALKPGGTFVSNAVTLEGEAALTAFHAEQGGEISRIAISHADTIGAHRGWRAAMPVVQLAVRKP
ncbi:MAG: precorrin-6y C5,15-methyltransferase (decarboxylating) subunit CbiE [Alphaproteobacteria bacterium]|nr:precorrin-6y C5,15-methyltransferase (decarboxylating) subunit CbiE [Alphaproteobacteria bacterium]